MRWISWITFVVGVWVSAAPFALGYSGMFQATASDVIVGILIAASSCGWHSRLTQFGGAIGP
jgi:hypothetical protein